MRKPPSDVEKMVVWLAKLHGKLRKLMRLEHWHYRMVFNEGCVGEGDIKTVATTRTNFKYLEYSVTYEPMALELFREKRYYDLYRISVHELTHVLLAEMSDGLDDATAPAAQTQADSINERTTSSIANILASAFNLYQPEPQGMVI